MLTLDQLADEYLAQHVAEANTIATLTWRLKRARDTFGSTRVDRLAISALRAWRATLPQRSAYAYVKALRQVLHYAVAVAVGLVDENLTLKIRTRLRSRARFRSSRWPKWKPSPPR